MNKDERPFAWTVDVLRKANLRPTCQRMGLVKLLFGAGPRHICAEDLFQEARNCGINLSLATVYNTLNQFKVAGLLQQIVTGSEKTFFDTTLTPHYHIYYEHSGRVEDVPSEYVTVKIDPRFMQDKKIKSVDVVVRG